MGIATLRKHKEWLQNATIDTDALDYIIEDWQLKTAPHLNKFSPEIAKKFRAANSKSALRTLLRGDLFLLLATACQRYDMLNAWCIDRCAEVQGEPYGHVDLWPREHYKSTILTFGITLFDIINSHGKGVPLDTKPLTTGIFSYTRTIAKAFLRQIKLELERNEVLKLIFDDIFYLNPGADSPKWAENEGIIVKRDINPKESTVEAWGLIDGQPTSKHFDRLVYDDIVTHDKVRTEYSRAQVVNAWENSISLISVGGKSRYAGTRKHITDVYSEIMERGAAKKRLYTPWADAEKTNGVLFSLEELQTRRRKMGEITWQAEYENDPMAASSFTLDYTQIVYDEITNYSNMNLYMLCDSSTGKHKKTDYSAFFVVGIDWSSNIALIDGIYDRLVLSDRFDALHQLYLSYPDIITIFYETTGLCEDIAYFKERMRGIGHIFHQHIEELHPKSSKEDRILKLEPMLTQRKLIFPSALHKLSKRGVPYDIVRILVYEEMKAFPFSQHDEGMDVLGHAVEKMQSGDMISPHKEDGVELDKFYEAQNFDSEILSTDHHVY